jgi:hypothetical protein
VTEGYPGGRHAAGAIPWLFAGAGIVVAVLGVAFAVVLTGNSTPLGSPPNHRPQAAASLASVSATASIQTPSPTPKPTHKRTPSASSSPAPSATSPSASPQPQPAPSPQPSRRTQASSVQLTATVNVDSGWHFQDFGQVVFEVADAGSTATGQLTASITLPAGASMMGGGGGNFGQSASDWSFGWACQPTSTGATCQHAAISAGTQTVGAIYFTLSGSTACGQPVELTVASGSSSTSAQSPDGISC